MKTPNTVVKGVLTPMKTITFKRPQVSHFFSDRYAYRERPNFLPELVGFGIIVVTAIWPLLTLARALAGLK